MTTSSWLRLTTAVLCVGSVSLMWLLPVAAGEKVAKSPEKSSSLTKEQLDGLWDNLASKDAALAFKAIRSLTNSPKESVAFLKIKLRPIPKPDREKIKKWIKELGSDRFAIRLRAMTNLKKNAQVSKSVLREAAKAPGSLEARLRIEKLLSQLQFANSPTLLRQYRALEALEYIRTPAAIDLLEELANGAEGAMVTEEAKASLDRLKK
ncbi:MAG: hypothetical protein ACFCD0_29965 [Gemmataceae bacterium]